MFEYFDYVMYVWVDVLINYLIGVGFLDIDLELFCCYWFVDLYMIGKDIIRFYVVYWLVFLMLVGIELL